ncbi:DNA primase [Riemerella columbipharyngis]|uniref:DNA primase, catalytic core n=1 Tax=Riemerella columbipharyngis TaxID=1071918 RepID=A0A1G7EYD1_9FLAO|nr:DNA primase [Riemerella columbipharyngis]SDE68710.1 DNA primase, catalytic core [Riemerella columbipharyngis]
MGYIKKEFIDRLLFNTDILEVCQSLGIQLQKKGAHYWCKSPFKEEKTPSCQIKASTQRFMDFSTDTYGSVVDLVMKVKGLSYPEAIEELARMKGLQMEYESQADTELLRKKRVEQKSLRSYLKAINKKFVENLHQLPKDHPAWQEIAKRGYTTEDVKEWQLGYAPGGKFIYELFVASGAVEIAKKLGLVNDKNNDKVWNRLTYPIYDSQDHIAGFAHRDLSGDPKQAKWMNPPETELYKKEKILFGLNSAKNAISKFGRVWLMEGYNDVIAWHKYGIENTVGICGTALTHIHIKELKKLTQKVTLCLDPDNAGRKAMLKYIPLLITEGFSVEVCRLPDVDPDDYSRAYLDKIQEVGLLHSLQPYINKGFDVLCLEKLKGDELDRANGIKELAEIISKISDTTLRNIYTDNLIKLSKQKPAFIRNLMKEKEAEIIQNVNSDNDLYQLPNGITTPLEQLIPIIEKYQLFISNNQIFVQERFDYPITFKSISNFSVEILQHMNDEKFASKLLRISNIHGDERIFDVKADALTTPLDFKKQCANQGNYQWNGNQKELDKLTAYLYDNMGVGRRVDVLGWNAEGFYAWNNSVTIPGQPSIPIDKNGIFHFDGHSYYVPSANEIYRANPYKFAQQKRVQLKSWSVPMVDYLGQMRKVHRDYGIIGMLFAFASAHQDIIVDVAKGFPLMFLYGPPSTGKDELYGCIKKMFGIAKTDFINLENKQSTGKAKLRSFGEFSNMVVHLSEFTNGDKEVDGMLKGIWDRGSYKRATLDSMVSTDASPILCSAIVTGNQAPTDDAVLTRLLYGEMTKNQFTVEEKREFEKLEQMTTENITAYMEKCIWYRNLFVEKFSEKFNLYKKIISARPAFEGMIDRIITNYSILGATHELLKDTNDFVFPFTTSEMLEVFDNWAKNLKNKLDNANVLSKLWDVFVACLYGTELQRLQRGVHLQVHSNLLYIRFTEVYNRIQTEWYPRFAESCPAKGTLRDKIKESGAFVEELKSFRFGNNINTSAYVIDLEKLENKESILFALNIQKDEEDKKYGMESLYPPATPNNSSREEGSPEVPF